jgi:predicted nucleic acid-binding protein
MLPGIDPGSIVLVDSSSLVYLIEGEPGSARRGAMESLLAEAAAAPLRLVASTIAWAELLEKPLEAGDGELAARYRRLLADSARIELREVDVAVAEAAAVLAASLPRARRRGLSTGDILQMATAIVAGAAAVLTNDEAWGLAPGCPRVILVDELAREMDLERD